MRGRGEFVRKGGDFEGGELVKLTDREIYFYKEKQKWLTN